MFCCQNVSCFTVEDGWKICFHRFIGARHSILARCRIFSAECVYVFIKELHCFGSGPVVSGWGCCLDRFVLSVIVTGKNLFTLSSTNVTCWESLKTEMGSDLAVAEVGQRGSRIQPQMSNSRADMAASAQTRKINSVPVQRQRCCFRCLQRDFGGLIDRRAQQDFLGDCREVKGMASCFSVAKTYAPFDGPASSSVSKDVRC